MNNLFKKIKFSPFLRVIRIELIISTWKVEVIPFNHTRLHLQFYFYNKKGWLASLSLTAWLQ
jgi:hypothetical protein